MSPHERRKIGPGQKGGGKGEKSFEEKNGGPEERRN